MKQTKTIVDMYTNKNQNSFIVFGIAICNKDKIER